MAKVSKFLKLDKDILLEYIYSEGNLVSENYNVLINSKDGNRSYIASNTSGTGNRIDNQLFSIDPIEGKWGKVNLDYYTFLQYKNYSASLPIRHDILKFHLPINWTFGEYLGFYVKIYVYDSHNENKYELSNFYFDMTDVSHQDLMNFSSPPLLFQEKLWGKNIKIEIPSPSAISSQLTNSNVTSNTINYNLTGGSGIGLNTPIFIDFHFIRNIQTINNVTTFSLTSGIISSLPKTPDFENLSLNIEKSNNGDYFEIYGTYNGNIAEFKKFIDDSVYSGNKYYVEYNITTYEQNIRGKTVNVTLTDNFNEPVEYRPIIKFSTTTAIIDVEMRLIDMLDDSFIIRRASYGMLQDEVSKYSLNLTKIEVSNAYKPKIYNIKSSINPELVGLANSYGIIPAESNPKMKMPVKRNSNLSVMGGSGVIVEEVKVPYPVLVDRFNVMAKSESSLLDGKSFFGFGKIQILLYPFDNVIVFSIATGTANRPNYMDLTRFNNIQFTIKHNNTSVSFPTYTESGQIDLVNGLVCFKIDESKFNQIKSIYNRGINVFYITGSNLSVTSVIYTGLFKIYDDMNNVAQLNLQASSRPEIILDPTPNKETVIATPRLAESEPLLKKKTLTRSATQNTNTNSSNNGGTIYIDSSLNSEDIKNSNFKSNL